jgi:hypothetical protein
MLLIENEEVIQTFSPGAPQKAFAEGICLWSSIRRSQHLDATSGCHACKIRPELTIIIPVEVLWSLPVRSCFSQRYAPPKDPLGSGLRSPGSPFVMRNSMMKKAKSERKKRSVTCKRITRPYLCRMIVQAYSPGLSTNSFGSNVLHIFLDGPFTYQYTQLE